MSRTTRLIKALIGVTNEVCNNIECFVEEKEKERKRELKSTILMQCLEGMSLCNELR